MYLRAVLHVEAVDSSAHMSCSFSQIQTHMNLYGSCVLACVLSDGSKENTSEFLFNSNEVNGGITTMERKLIMANAKQTHNNKNNNNRNASYAITRSSASEYTCTTYVYSRTRSHVLNCLVWVRCTGSGSGSVLITIPIVWVICLRLRHCIFVCNSIRLIIQFRNMPVKLA